MVKVRQLSDKAHEDYFEEIYREYFDRLYAFALIITKSSIIAKEVVSDVFYNLWNSKTDLFSIKELKSYLFTSVKHQAIRTLSSDPLHFNTENYNKVISTIEYVNPEELLICKELDDFLQHAISNLPPQCQLVFQMVKDKGMKYDEVATKLNISKDTVKYHLKTAIKKIKGDLEDHFATDNSRKMYPLGYSLLLCIATLSATLPDL